jgi:hypothetical protein
MKHIRDQLAVTRSMLKEQLQRLAAHGGHLDDYRVLAALAETQYHLTRTLDARPVKGGEVGDDGPGGFDEARIFDFMGDGTRLVLWPIDDWCCPACGDPRFRMDGAPKPEYARPSKDERYVRSFIAATCQNETCGFEATVGSAALSWHRERAGGDPTREVALWREKHGLEGRAR